MKKIKIIRFVLIGIPVLIVIGLALVLFFNWRIESYGEKYVFDRVNDVPHNKVGLLLGTSKFLKGGYTNLYFSYRIAATVALFKAQKIDFILVSGDNSVAYYNEPMDMKKALMEQGVPEEVIFLDYAGFRTLDSVVRSQKVFGQNEITIISQEFHNKRAIFIANSFGLKAIGFNAKDVSAQAGFKTNFREKFARVKVFLDLYLLQTQPKFLGEKILIK